MFIPVSESRPNSVLPRKAVLVFEKSNMSLKKLKASSEYTKRRMNEGLLAYSR